VGAQDGFGPWLDDTVDSEFGDLDMDGDLDVVIGSKSAGLGGEDLRLFLNNGAGQFDERWPWADAGADITMDAVDVELADLDGDSDIDIVVVEYDETHVYRNELSSGGGWAAESFFEQTPLTASFDQGRVAFADLHGDADLDLWVTRADWLHRNDGCLQFAAMPWLEMDSSLWLEDVAFLDYDSDGDLDAVAPGGGSPGAHIFQNGLAQGLDPGVDGLMHLNSPSAPGTSLATWDETSSLWSDQPIATDDLDGDPEIFFARWIGGLWVNALGVPDTHAPTFSSVTMQGDKADGSDTPIVAQVLDNSDHRVIARYDVDLFYAVDGGPPTCVQMPWVGGQSFRAVIPGGVTGSIAYRVQAADAIGNVGVSTTHTYDQSGGTTPLFENQGCGTLGVAGDPYLRLSGPLTPLSTLSLDLRDAPPSAPMLVLLSFTSTPILAAGGLVFTNPINNQFPSTTTSGGTRHASAPLTASWPSGLEFWFQAVIADGTSPHGLVLSNAVKGTTP
jgi:hypothetical protein